MTKPLTSTDGIQIVDPQQLTRDQRLERWASALDKLGDAPLCTLRETEHQHPCERILLRQDNSPLTVAFEEPVLRSAGLEGDTFGEASRFFSLSDQELHHILCYCHFGTTVRASEAAARVRSMKTQARSSNVPTWTLGIWLGVVASGTGLLLVLGA